MNNILRFLAGEIDVCEFNGVISREKPPKGKSELLHLTSSELNKEIYTLWHNTTGIKGKSTGGKKPYAMLMLQDIENLQGKITYEELGIMFVLSRYSKWETGLLIKKRTKKPLKFDDLMVILNLKKDKLSKIIKSLKDKYILDYRDEGYYLSRTFIRKGAK